MLTVFDVTTPAEPWPMAMLADEGADEAVSVLRTQLPVIRRNIDAGLLTADQKRVLEPSPGVRDAQAALRIVEAVYGRCGR